jgi:iron-sulfur cluster repair protein YtfE (RIC family)
MSSLIHDIDPTLSVNDILRRYPASLKVLTARGIDTCCDGGLPLSVATADANLDLSELIDELKAVVFGAEETTP